MGGKELLYTNYILIDYKVDNPPSKRVLPAITIYRFLQMIANFNNSTVWKIYVGLIDWTWIDIGIWNTLSDFRCDIRLEICQVTTENSNEKIHNPKLLKPCVCGEPRTSFFLYNKKNWNLRVTLFRLIFPPIAGKIEMIFNRKGLVCKNNPKEIVSTIE